MQLAYGIIFETAMQLSHLDFRIYTTGLRNMSVTYTRKFSYVTARNCGQVSQSIASFSFPRLGEFWFQFYRGTVKCSLCGIHGTQLPYEIKGFKKGIKNDLDVRLFMQNFIA